MSSFMKLHHQLRWHFIHKQIKEDIYLNLTEDIYDINFNFMNIIRIPCLVPYFE